MSGQSVTTIRKARPEDCGQLLGLIKELAVYEKQPDAVTVSMEEFIDSGFGSQQVWEAFVAEQEINGSLTIIGMSLFYIRYSTWKGRRLYLEDLIVTESMRGQGIGKRLFDITLDVCRERGYNGMVWQALDWNEPALNFYRKYNADFDYEWVNISVEMNHDTLK